MKKTRILVADNQYLTRLGLKCLLNRQAHINIVGEAENEHQLLEMISRTSPDLIILDYHQQKDFSTESIRKINLLTPHIGLLVISADNNKHSIYQVIENGVSGFLTKSCEEKEILDAVDAVMEGKKFFCNKILEIILERSFAKPGEECAPTPLSNREIEVVKLISKGLIAKEIASNLNLSTHTIYTHRKNIMKKLNISSSPELVLYAVNNGILQ